MVTPRRRRGFTGHERPTHRELGSKGILTATGLSLHFLPEEGADPIRIVEVVVSEGNTQTVITRHTVNPEQDGRLTLELDLDPGGYLFSATSEDGRKAVLYLWWNTMSRTDSFDLVLEQLR